MTESMTPEENTKFDRRLSRLEAVVESLASNMQGMMNSITQLSERLRTNWGVVFSGAGVMIAIIAYIGYLGVAKPQQQMLQELIELRMSFYEHISDGHPGVVQKEIVLRNEAQDRQIQAIVERIKELGDDQDIIRRDLYLGVQNGK